MRTETDLIIEELLGRRLVVDISVGSHVGGAMVTIQNPFPSEYFTAKSLTVGPARPATVPDEVDDAFVPSDGSPACTSS